MQAAEVAVVPHSAVTVICVRAIVQITHPKIKLELTMCPRRCPTARPTTFRAARHLEDRFESLKL